MVDHVIIAISNTHPVIRTGNHSTVWLAMATNALVLHSVLVLTKFKVEYQSGCEGNGAELPSPLLGTV